MNTSPASSPLRERAALLHASRQFFSHRRVLEVDCPALSRAASIDLHIDLIQTKPQGYLVPSYEYGMKRLLSQGIGDIYQIGHVFREGEIGPLHNPEFTMTEWYRIGFTFEQMIDETLDYIRLFLTDRPVKKMTYRNALKHFLAIDILHTETTELLALARKNNISLPPDATTWDKDTLLQLLISFLIEPQLGTDHFFVLTHFPISQAALARTEALPDGETAALRFEVYCQGIELANGYHELTDPLEQRKRCEEARQARRLAGKDPLVIDENFLKALEEGLPDCCGVAVGFDRLMLLRLGQKTLKNVLPFTWENA